MMVQNKLQYVTTKSLQKAQAPTTYIDVPHSY
jgi:hypothetical protein